MGINFVALELKPLLQIISIIVFRKVWWWLVAKLCLALVTSWTEPLRLLCPWNSPGKNTRMGSHSLLWGIFWTQGLNLGLLYYRQILYQVSYLKI